MKLKFNKKLDYQLDAIASVVNVFEGQRMAQDNFTVVTPSQQLPFHEIAHGDLGIGNRLTLLPEGINEILRKYNLKTCYLQQPLCLLAMKPHTSTKTLALY